MTPASENDSGGTLCCHLISPKSAAYLLVCGSVPHEIVSHEGGWVPSCPLLPVGRSQRELKEWTDGQTAASAEQGNFRSLALAACFTCKAAGNGRV